MKFRPVVIAGLVLAVMALAGFAVGAGYPKSIYKEQGGMRQVIPTGASLDVESGGELDIESGGALKLAGTQVTATAAELNKLDDAALDLFMSAAAAGSNVCEVTIRALDAAGSSYVTEPFTLTVWLSDDSGAIGLTGTSASGTVQAKSGGGYSDFGTLTAKKALIVQADTNGTYILEITDSAKTGFYVGATIPGTGATAVIANQLVAGNYG